MAQPDNKPKAQPDNKPKAQPDNKPKAQPDAPPKAPAKILIRAVHGLMVHPFIEDKAFNTDTITEVTEIDDFLKCQIEAGKLEVV